MTFKAEFDSTWRDLARVGRHTETGGYRRYAWTPIDTELKEWFAGEAEARGLDVMTDRVGNQWAWWGDPDNSTIPGLVTGSHLDSVPDGGAYDGPLGVVSAFFAIDELRRRGVVPDRPIAVANFIDEEGARFGIACSGSRLLTGKLNAQQALALVDQDGVTMAEAMKQAGHDPHQVGADTETLRRVGMFIELHIEQGRGLIDLNRPVAIGEEILPHGRWRLEFQGEANHAGTTRLIDRRDPMLNLARALTEARTLAETAECLATIAKVSVKPNGVNAIPSSVTAWLDARGKREAAVRQIATKIGALSGGSVTEESFTQATRFDAFLQKRISSILHEAPILPTGAGHDAGILASADIPAAMLFVRNPTGVSHSPEEFAELEDCYAGVTALADVIEKLVTSGQPPNTLL